MEQAVNQEHQRRHSKWWVWASVVMLWLAGCTQAEAEATLIPTITIPTATATETLIPTTIPTETLPPLPVADTATPVPGKTYNEIIAMSHERVMTLDAVRSPEDVQAMIEQLPKQAADAAVALGVLHIDTMRFEQDASGMVVECDEANKICVVMAAKHSLLGVNGPLHNLEISQPHKGGEPMRLTSDTMRIFLSPTHDIGFVAFRYEGSPPFSALGRDKLKTNWAIDPGRRLGLLGFTQSAPKNNTVFPLIDVAALPPSDYFNPYTSNRTFILNEHIAENVSGTSVVDMETGEVVGWISDMSEWGGVAGVLPEEVLLWMDQAKGLW